MQLYESTEQIPDKHRIFTLYDTELIYSDDLSKIIDRKPLERPVRSLVTRKKLRLITSVNVIYAQTKHWEDDPRPRCPYCEYVDNGKNVVTWSSGVKRGNGSHPRRFETSRFCPFCTRTFVKNKVVEAVY